MPHNPFVNWVVMSEYIAEVDAAQLADALIGNPRDP